MKLSAYVDRAIALGMQCEKLSLAGLKAYKLMRHNTGVNSHYAIVIFENPDTGEVECYDKIVQCKVEYDELPMYMAMTPGYGSVYIVPDNITQFACSIDCCFNSIKQVKLIGGKGVTSLVASFKNSYSLQSVDFSLFKPDRLYDLSSAFQYCTHLKYLDLTPLNLDHLTDISDAFDGCVELEYLKLPHVNELAHMEYTFFSCRKLRELDLTNVGTHRLRNCDKAFYDCENLQTIKFNTIDKSKLDCMFDDTNTNKNRRIIVNSYI